MLSAMPEVATLIAVELSIFIASIADVYKFCTLHIY